ncbi:MAG: transposase [Proteobacteria bacterium]|nr:transposase [Pseudomonadota bacterium]MCH8950651.1 transposase [Pseudomonadota bacterium]
MARKLGTRPREPIPKPRYRVTNWPEYNRALVERGSAALWPSDEVARGWRARGGKGRLCRDVAIRRAPSPRAVLRLTLRQARGFLASLANQRPPGLPAPHYTSLR